MVLLTFHSLVQNTEGSYCFIESADGIGPAFAECL